MILSFKSFSFFGGFFLLMLCTSISLFPLQKEELIDELQYIICLNWRKILFFFFLLHPIPDVCFGSCNYLVKRRTRTKKTSGCAVLSKIYHLSVTFDAIQMVLETYLVTITAIKYFISFWLFIYLLISTGSCREMKFYASIFYQPILTTVSMETSSTSTLSQLLVLIRYQDGNIYQYRITGREDKDKLNGALTKTGSWFSSEQCVTNFCFRIRISGFC